MILVQRVIPFFTGLVTAAGFTLLLVSPFEPLMPPALVALATLAPVAVLIGMLSRFRVRQFQSWNFVGVPIIFIASGFCLLLFLEDQSMRIALAATVSLLVFFFSEHVFTYVHLPAKYPLYALEHLSLLLNVLSIFFASAAAFGTLLFLQTPLTLLACLFFPIAFFMIYGTLWVSKVEGPQALPYAFAGAAVVTELFAVIAFLPTGLYTNAAAVALIVYLFLGFTRAHFLDRLSRGVVRRYLLVGFGLLVLIAGTAKWV